MSIQSLREERTAKAREYRNILDNFSGPLSDEVKTKLDGLEADITGIEDRIAREQRRDPVKDRWESGVCERCGRKQSMTKLRRYTMNRAGLVARGRENG